MKKTLAEIRVAEKALDEELHKAERRIQWQQQ
ncbi:hypothetical protein KIPB_016528, partial [Kipferlia bialata]|eukprot:g16528.t1